MTCSEVVELIVSISAVITSIVAVIITVFTNNKQYKIQMYDKRLAAYRLTDRMSRFITRLETFNPILIASDGRIEHQILEILSIEEIKIDDIYEFSEIKFILSKNKFENTIKDTNKLYIEALSNYRMIKDQAKNGSLISESIVKSLCKDKNTICDNLDMIKEELGSTLQIK